MYISKNDICNLSRIPVSIDMNPLYLASCDYVMHKNIDRVTCLLDLFTKNSNFKNLEELHSYNNCKELKLISAYIFFLPWFHDKIFNSPEDKIKDKAFLKFSAEEKSKKITSLIDSISLNGFDTSRFPTRQGGVSGYFLEKNSKRKFYVVSGNHRVSAFFSLFPDMNIPVILSNISHFKKRDRVSRNCFDKDGNFKTVKYEECSRWPAVLSSQISETGAQKIFSSYFND